MKNVLYISYDGMTDPLGQSQVLPYLKELSKRGYVFHLISFEKEECFRNFQKHIQNICSDAGIHWYPLSYTKKPPLFSTIYDVQRMKRLARHLHQTHQFQLVHCRSYLSALVGMGMKKRFGINFLFDMRGFYADERVEGAIWSMRNPLFRLVYRFFKKKEIEFFQTADYTISLTYNGKQEIESWHPFKQVPPLIQVIPCCVDLTLFNPNRIQETDKKNLRSQLGINMEDTILGYVGSIGTWYMLPEMLDFFKIYQHRYDKAKFLFVTGESPDTILKLSFQKGIPKESIVVTSCLHKDVPLFISLFSHSIFFICPSFSKKASSPTKQGEIMAMGIPLICNAGVGDTDNVINQYQAGVVVPEFQEEAYELALNSLQLYNQEQAIKGAHKFYGLSMGVNRYVEIYRLLTLSKTD